MEHLNFRMQTIGQSLVNQSYGVQLGLGRGPGRPVVSRIVLSCADIMKEYPKKSGDAAGKELAVFCKNKAQLKMLEERNEQKKVAVEPSEYWLTSEDDVGPAGIASIMTGISIA